MGKFYDIKLSDIYKETEDTSVLTLQIPEDLKQYFNYRQGQHVTLRKTINSEDLRRSYSLCSSPLENKWQVAVKQIPGGIFSTYVNNVLKKDDILQVMPPSGNFGIETAQNTPKNYLFFAAGSGITPIISMIKTHLAIEPFATCKLFFVNKTAKSIIFKEALEQLRNKYFGRLEIYYFLTQEKRDVSLFNGRLNDEKMQILLKTFIDIPDTNDVFLCGPEQMVNYVKNYLINAGLDKKYLHSELFVSGLSKADIERQERLKKQNLKGVNITVIDGGKEFNFTMTKHFDNILEAAINAGADLPFACKAGVCSTCKCQVKKGKVEMKVNYALEENLLKQNMVLSCQAVPKSKHVVLNFDV